MLRNEKIFKKMKLKNSITIICYIFFNAILLMQFNNSLAQNFILLHKNGGKNNVFVHNGDKVNIITNNSKTIQGTINEIKDTTIIILNKLSADNSNTNYLIEIPIKSIRYFYFRHNNFMKDAGGAISLTGSFIETIVFFVAGLMYNGNISGLEFDKAAINVGAYAAFSFGIYYFIIYKKKYDTKYKYDLIIVKPKQIN